jgi:hypothetical protein
MLLYVVKEEKEILTIFLHCRTYCPTFYVLVHNERDLFLQHFSLFPQYCILDLVFALSLDIFRLCNTRTFSSAIFTFPRLSRISDPGLCYLGGGGGGGGGGGAVIVNGEPFRRTDWLYKTLNYDLTSLRHSCR